MNHKFGIYLILILIFLFIPSIGGAFPSFEEEARLNSVRQRGTCFQAACKVGGGLVLFFSGKAAMEASMEQDSVLMKRTGQLGCVTGLGMAVDGVQDFLDLLYTFFRPPSKLRLKQKKTGQFVRYAKKDHQEEAHREFIREIGLVKSTVNVGLVAFLSSVYFESVLDNFNRGIGPFDLSYPEGDVCSSYQMLCMPLTATMILGASGAQLIYNLRELKQLWNDPKRNLGEVPLFGLLNGLAEIALSKMIQRHFQYTLREEYYDSSNTLYKIKIYENHLDMLPFMCMYFLNVHGHYQDGASLIQMGRNAYAYVSTYFQRYYGPQFKIDEDLPSTTDVAELEKRGGHPPSASLNTQVFNEGFRREEPEPTPRHFIKEKKKTRGAPGMVPQEPLPHRLPMVPEAVEDPRRQERQAGLNRMNTLRDKYPLKVNEVMSEVNNLLKFLPHGQLDRRTANVCKIIWYPALRPVSLTFELPHGRDSIIFRGNKRDWVLNAIELAYLHGLDEQELRIYIEDNNALHLLRLPQVLMFILGNRAI